MNQEQKILTGIGIATVAIVVGAAFLVGGTKNTDMPEKPADINVLIRPDSHKTSSESAKVTLVEFGDFQCPACGASHPIVKELISNYKDDMTFVYRHYPLPMHKNARIAALAAESAGAQGKFFEMENLLFENQKEWSEDGDPLNKFFIKYATDLGLDVKKFEADVKNKTYEKKIEKDQLDGNSVGVASTPTFFINGQIQKGGLPYDEFKAKIDKILKK